MTIQGELIDYQHDGAELQGLLVWDDAISGIRPGVLVSHAWGGRSDFEDARAEDLARLGYAGLALDLYGKGVRGSSREENSALIKPFIDDRSRLQARMQEALAALKACAPVDAASTAVIGYCFGGLCALDLARSGSEVRGAVSIHGLLQAPETRATIKAKVLALHGWDDPMATPEQLLAFATEMTDAGVDWQVHAYGLTMHAFTNPAANDREFGTVYNADADRRSWIAIQNFLAEVLA